MRNISMPQKVAQRIMQRCVMGKAVVIVPRNHKPSRVYEFEAYLKTIGHTKKVKPWEHRRRKKHASPLGAIEGRVVSPLRREALYE